MTPLRGLGRFVTRACPENVGNAGQRQIPRDFLDFSIEYHFFSSGRSSFSNFFLRGILFITKSLYFLVPTIVSIPVSTSCWNINSLPSTAFKTWKASMIASFASPLARGSCNMARRTLCRRHRIPGTGFGGPRHCKNSALLCEVCIFLLSGP